MSTDSLLQVRVPPGLVAGSTMTIQGPDGRLFAVIVPPGVAAGDLLTVDVRDVTEGGVTVVATTAEQLPVDRTGERGADKASRAALGAAAVGAVVGTLLIGPITGVVVAGAALYATTRQDNIGSAARATGGSAVSLYEKAADSAEKHHVGEKLAAAGQATYKKAAQIDSQYHVTENLKQATVVAAAEAKKLNDKYDITGNASRAVAAGTRSVLKFMDSASSGESPGGRNTVAGV